MEEYQLGVSAIVVLLILREIFGFLKGKRTSNSEIDKVSIISLLSRQTEILEELKTINSRHTEMLIGLQYIGNEVKVGQAQLHDDLHDTRR